MTRPLETRRTQTGYSLATSRYSHPGSGQIMNRGLIGSRFAKELYPVAQEKLGAGRGCRMSFLPWRGHFCSCT